MTQQQYVYKVLAVEKVVDGDTYWLHLDVGFRQRQLTEIRLLGYDCPERRKGSPKERAAAQQATAYATLWFHDGLNGNPREAAADIEIWVRTEKDPDDFGRWLGEVWSEVDGQRGTSLGEWLHQERLASVWPTRWHEEFDAGGPVDD